MELFFDEEENTWGVGDYEAEFSFSEARMVQQICLAFPEASWGFVEALMRRCGWDEEKKIAVFVPSQELSEIPRRLLPPLDLEA